MDKKIVSTDGWWGVKDYYDSDKVNEVTSLIWDGGREGQRTDISQMGLRYVGLGYYYVYHCYYYVYHHYSSHDQCPTFDDDYTTVMLVITILLGRKKCSSRLDPVIALALKTANAFSRSRRQQYGKSLELFSHLLQNVVFTSRFRSSRGRSSQYRGRCTTCCV